MEEKFSIMLGRIGEASALRPCRTIGICLAISFICAIGLMRLKTINSAEQLWVDPNSPSFLNKMWVDQTFGDQYRIIRIMVVNDGEDKENAPTGYCANTDGTQMNSAPCTCGFQGKTCAAGSFCTSRYSLCFSNTLSVEAFREMMQLDQSVREITIQNKDTNAPKKKFMDFCTKSVLPGSPCLISSPLEIWSAPSLGSDLSGDAEVCVCVSK